jgi:hypothetical protein
MRYRALCSLVLALFPQLSRSDEIMCERNLSIDPSTIWRRVQRYAPELNERIRRGLKPTNGSWRTDETMVLAFSVSGRTREFGIRLAVGSQPRLLLMRVITEGAAMAIGGIAVGLACGFGLAQLAGSFLADLKRPGLLPVVSSALVLLLAAVTASVIPAARAARVDVIQVLRTE